MDVVRPVLAEGFRVEEQQPLLAPVPTYTMFARTSVFAGGYPNGGWRGIKSGGLPETKESWPLKMLASIPLKSTRRI